MALTTPMPGLVVGETAAPPTRLWRLTLDQYHEMVRTGILHDGDPVEFLDGWLVEKMIHNPPHRLAIGLVHDALEAVLSGSWHLDIQVPIALPTSEPEPDVFVVRGARRDYVDRHPGAKDVPLVVEVSDSTLEYDETSTRIIHTPDRASMRIVLVFLIRLPF
jgi:Uma2 family endonuclease